MLIFLIWILRILVVWQLINEPVDAPTDIAAVRNNKISITPVTYEMTRTQTVADLDNILCSSGDCVWY